MPNYGLVINSRFRPFSYQEMLAPVAQSTQAHQEVENAYSGLQVQADQWKKIAQEEPNSRAAQMYNNYANSLEAAAEDLAKNGLNPSSRATLWDMTKRYSSEMNPIEEAYKRKQLLFEEQRKAGDSRIYEMDASDLSIDRFLENSTLQPRFIDRKDLLNRSMAEYGSLAKSLEAYGKGQPIDNYTNTFVQQYGITRDSASNFINAVRSGNISSADPTLRAIYDNLYNSTGVSSWDNPTAQEAVKNTILEGVVGAIGQTSVNTFQDVAKVKALEHYYATKRMEKQNEIDADRAAKAAKGEQHAAIGYRDRYDITNDKRIKKYKRSGIINEDSNGQIRVDREAFNSWKEMSPKEKKDKIESIDAQIKEIHDILSSEKKKGKSNPEFYMNMTYQIANRKYPELKFPNVEGRLTPGHRTKLIRYLQEEENTLRKTRKEIKKGQATDVLLSDLADLSGLRKSDIDNIELLEKALNTTIGDTYKLNQDIYYTVDDSQSAQFMKTLINKQGGLAALPQRYIDDANGNFGKISHLSTEKLSNSKIDNIIVKKDNTGAQHAYYELTPKDGGKRVALQLPDDLGSDLIEYSNAMHEAKRSYLLQQTRREQNHSEQNNKELPLYDFNFYASLVSPYINTENGYIEEDEEVLEEDFDNILNNFEQAAARLGATNKTKTNEITTR